MKIHELKTDPRVFDQVREREKKFEIRFNDRKYAKGDYLLLKRTGYTGQEMRTGLPLVYTGQEALLRVEHILHGPIYGLMEGWVIMSIKLC